MKHGEDPDPRKKVRIRNQNPAGSGSVWSSMLSGIHWCKTPTHRLKLLLVQEAVEPGLHLARHPGQADPLWDCGGDERARLGARAQRQRDRLPRQRRRVLRVHDPPGDCGHVQQTLWCPGRILSQPPLFFIYLKPVRDFQWRVEKTNLSIYNFFTTTAITFSDG